MIPSKDHKSGVTPRIRHVVNEAGGQSAFARLVWGDVDANRGKVYRWYHGISGIRHDEALVVADKCQCSFLWLLTGRGTPTGSLEAPQPNREHQALALDGFLEGVAKPDEAHPGYASRAWRADRDQRGQGGHSRAPHSTVAESDAVTASAIERVLGATLGTLHVRSDEVPAERLEQSVALMLAAMEATRCRR